MSVGLATALAIATLLGVTHAVEPDHVAGITSLTGRHADTRHAALVGVCFSLGHVVLVIGWLAVAVALGRASLPRYWSPSGPSAPPCCCGPSGLD